jgi:hypothetical protein
LLQQLAQPITRFGELALGDIDGFVRVIGRDLFDRPDE